MPETPVTIADVAAAADVSTATVSYVLNGKEGASKETRQRVEQAVADLGYVHRRRRPSRPPKVQHQVMAILSGTSDDGFEPNYYVAELLRGVEAELGRHDATLSVRFFKPQEYGIEKTLEYPPGTGLIFLGGSFPPEIENVIDSDTHAVIAGTVFPQWSRDAVLVDNRRGAYLATHHLLERGCRRIALLNGPTTTSTSESKFLGYQDALREFAIDPDCDLVREIPFEADSAFNIADELLRKFRGGLDGFVCADDPFALSALQAAQRANISVPEQLRIVGYGGSGYGLQCRPQLSTIEVFQRRVGSLAARHLIQRMNGEAAESIRIHVSPRLNVRESS